MKTALWWVRRDLRRSDNQALTAAMRQAEQVIPVFILDPKLLNSAYNGEKRTAFLFQGLQALDNDLRRGGSYLVVRRGEPVQALKLLLNETGAEAIFAEADHSPYARCRDLNASRELPVHFTPGVTVHSPETVVKADGTPYTVFTPYSKAWLAQPWPGNPLPAPREFHTPAGVQSERIPDSPQLGAQVPFKAGETEAQRRLDEFSERLIYGYAENRNRMDLAGTSGLSPYLRFGMVSSRQAVAAARRADALAEGATARRSAETWLNELIWREFYIAILYHYPYVRHTAFRPALRSIPWINDGADFSAWVQGLTGYPVVDAAMRQLLLTGWMHNRARMISASFLTKDLLVDWRRGERHFMQHLVDGDPAANNGGWQWTAGTGTDAAPYFRVFNPVLQSKKFDPSGAYIRRFVPELANVPDDYIHTPWMMTAEKQKECQCLIGKDYPAPILDHQLARERVLMAYKA
jgi:deoxyribodipyrimidine photo-lyase